MVELVLIRVVVVDNAYRNLSQSNTLGDRGPLWHITVLLFFVSSDRSSYGDDVLLLVHPFLGDVRVLKVSFFFSECTFGSLGSFLI